MIRTSPSTTSVSLANALRLSLARAFATALPTLLRRVAPARLRSSFSTLSMSALAYQTSRARIPANRAVASW